MNFNASLTIVWSAELSQPHLDNLTKFLSDLETEQLYTPNSVSLGSGVYSYLAVEKLFQFISLDEAYSLKIEDIQYSKPDTDTVDRFLTKINGIEYNPQALLKDIWDNEKFTIRVNDKPYIGDYYAYFTGNNSFFNEDYLRQIEEFKRDRPKLFEMHRYGIMNCFDHFSFFKDERDFIRILLSDFTEKDEELLRSKLPECIQKFNPRLSLQIMYSGAFSQVHRDHDRVTTLFWLITEPTADTRYYFLHPRFRYLRYIYQFGTFGPSQCMYQFKRTIQPETWYLFNNAELHSVHNHDPINKGLRLAYTIDFIDIDYETVAKTLTENGFTLSNLD